MGSSNRTSRREKIRDYIDANRKSPALGSLYALIFGPFGCIYTDPKVTVIGVLAAIAAGLIYWPLIAAVWLSCVLLAPFRVRAYNQRVRRNARYVVL
ncbi:MAG: hypothetical protein QNJ91_15515 [Gammaproteobacteria bacterium]|nr:hypothetical protein [Gammaproteobacteria bacterium]